MLSVLITLEALRWLHSFVTAHALAVTIVTAAGLLALPALMRSSKRGLVASVVFALAIVVSGQKPETNAPPDGASPPLMACSPRALSAGEEEPAATDLLRFTAFSVRTNGTEFAMDWAAQAGVTGLQLWFSPEIVSNSWSVLDEWTVALGRTNDTRFIPFGGSFTNGAAGFFRLRAHGDPEAALYTTMEIVRSSSSWDNSVTVVTEDALGTHAETFMLEVGATNVVPIRIGRRYAVSSAYLESISVRSNDPAVTVSGDPDEDDAFTVCRPVRVLLTDIPPPADAVYVDYLCAVIDHELGDAARYAMDASAFDRGRAAARAAYRRSHCP